MEGYRKIISGREWRRTERRVQRAVGHGRKAAIKARKEPRRVGDDRRCSLLACSSHGCLLARSVCEPPAVESRNTSAVLYMRIANLLSYIMLRISEYNRIPVYLS